ncbi:MAG: aldehyde dehydrogenase family protein, partial [Candidatus Acidiferrales bacterium]
MSSEAKTAKFQAASAQFKNEEARAEDLFNKQKAYFASDATKTYEWRIDQLDRLIRMLKDNEQRFRDASRDDFKTAIQENVFEVSATIATAEFAKSQLKDWMRPVEAPLPKFLAASGHKGIVYREPYGVTLIICPFNGPLLLSLRPAVAALSAGNPCILKLSELLPATDELLLELIPKYFEPEALSAVVGAREVVTKLLELPFDFMFLTGSVNVGKVVMRAAAENLTPVLLELGGQNPTIVDETANIPDAAKKIVWGAMAWGGQWCTSPGYAVVHESVADQFVAECKKAVVELYGPDPKSNSDYSRVISPAAVERLASLIDPQKVVYGGKSDASARYLDPTILPDFLVRQNDARRNLRPAFADPHLLRSRKAARQDQVAPQAACRLRVQPKSAGNRSDHAIPLFRRGRRESDQRLLVHR